MGEVRVYLAHKKTPSPRTLQQAYLGPYVSGAAVSYERGAPVTL